MAPDGSDSLTQLPALQRQRFEEFLREAKEAERGDQYLLAIECLERALKLAPDHYGCRIQLASLSNQIGHIPRALSIYEQLLQGAPDDSILLNNMGSVYFDLGHTEKALESYKEAIQRDPGNYLPHANLAYSCALTGDTESALVYAQKLQDLVPHNRYRPFAKVAEFRAFLVNGQKDKALTLLQNPTVEDKQNLLFNIQRLLYAKDLKIEDEKEAIITRSLSGAKEALHRGQNPHKTHYRITLFHLLAGNHAAAVKFAKSALAEGPYRGIIRYAGLYYLDELGLPKTDKIHVLWQRGEEAAPLTPVQGSDRLGTPQ